MDLAHFHGGEGGFVALWRHARAAAAVDQNGNLRQRALDHHGVADDADVGAEADQLDRLELRQHREEFDELRGAEARLVKDRRGVHIQRRVDVPALRSENAVRHGQIPALLRLGVVVPVRVARKDDERAGLACLGDLLLHGRDDPDGLFCSERAVNKILLHVDDSQYLHGNPPPQQNFALFYHRFGQMHRHVFRPLDNTV